MSTQHPGAMTPHPAMYNRWPISWSWLMAVGFVMFILGALAIIFPSATSVSIDVFLGILLLIAGAVRLLHMFSSRSWGDFLLKLIIAAIFLAAGVLLVARPVEGTLTLTLLLGIFFLAQGLANVLVSLISTHRKGWQWVLLNGIIAFIIGALIWASWPSSAAWVIGLLVGVWLIFDGMALIMFSLALHNEERYGAA